MKGDISTPMTDRTGRSTGAISGARGSQRWSPGDVLTWMRLPASAAVAVNLYQSTSVPDVNDALVTCAGIDACGRLADIAPTLLDLMELPKPPEMTGQSLLR